jgi:hypothetical protein
VRLSLLGAALAGGAILFTGLAAVPASAASAPAIPNLTGDGVWAGYTETGAITSISVNWNEPTYTCPTNLGGQTNLVLSIDNPAAPTTDETVGAGEDCSSTFGGNDEFAVIGDRATATSAAWYQDSEWAGDAMSESVSRDGTNYTTVITDQTRGWSLSRTTPMTGTGTVARIMLGSDADITPAYTPITVTGVLINGAPADPANLVAHNGTEAGGATDTVSPISGGAFTITRSR